MFVKAIDMHVTIYRHLSCTMVYYHHRSVSFIIKCEVFAPMVFSMNTWFRVHVYAVYVHL